MPFIDTLVAGYALLALTHLFTQINLAHMEFLRHYKDVADRLFTPSVAVVIASYNEAYYDLYQCVKSALDQAYPNVKVVLVDDGSKDKSAYRKIIYDFIDNPNFIPLESEKNVGKRNVQKIGFDHIDKEVDLIVTIDSDTILAEDCLTKLVQKFKDSKVGAITGNVRAIRNQGLLSRLIDGRYFAAFNQERAAQSLFGVVLCCSGPLAAYRSEIIRAVKEKYTSQRFLGLDCTYGDDRHLTNLVLDEGYSVKFEPKAHAITGVPNKLRQFFKQQVRWNKSFYRELLWTVKFYWKNPKHFHFYTIYDLCIQTVLPFLLMATLVYAVYRSIFESPIYLIQYIIILAGIALLRTTYSFMRTRDFNLLLFPIYSILHVFFLIPARLYALCTMKETKWGTR